MNTWKLTYTDFNPEEETQREALCTLGNGYFGTRGTAPEFSASKAHYPGTYITGVYNTLPTEIADRTIDNEDLVNCPNWLMFNCRVNGADWLTDRKYKLISYKKELNLRKGLLSRRCRWKDKDGRITRVENHRIVSMAHPHCGALRYTITPENYDGEITIRTGIDGMVTNANVERYRQLNSRHLLPVSCDRFGDEGIFLQMQTIQSKIQVTEAMRNLVYKNHRRLRPLMKIITEDRQRIFHEFTVHVKRGDRITVEKLVSIFTSRDQGVADNCELAQKRVMNIENFEALYKPHAARWAALWKRFDIEIKGDEFIQQALRVHTFHLLQTASTFNADIDAGMPVRGLHGEAYRGHVFWDEVFIFPFYNLRSPEITRALLMYRYRRLGAAKEYAQRHGFKGAMYPWQTASKGDEQTQIMHLNPVSNRWGPDYSSLQRHVSLAVAHNVWTYFSATGDRDFLDRYGAEMIIEIAHFWGSISRLNNKNGRYEIEGVMGPDEFHEKYPDAEKGGLRNNAYTNIMAVWVIEKALKILNVMLTEEDRHALLTKTNISEADLKKWEEIMHRMTVPIDGSGLIHQFEGYMDLEELDWAAYRKKHRNIHRIDRILKAEGRSPDQYKVSKQADVLMIFYLLPFDEVRNIFRRLGHPCPKDIIKKNFDYYLARTSHGSTLSMVVHAFVADLIGRRKMAAEFFQEALKSDLQDTQEGTAQEGIHSGVMGGTLDLFLRAFAGIEIKEGALCLNPRLPKKWKKARFQIRHKNIWFLLEIHGSFLCITAHPPKESHPILPVKIPIVVKKRNYYLRPEKTLRIHTKRLFRH